MVQERSGLSNTKESHSGRLNHTTLHAVLSVAWQRFSRSVPLPAGWLGSRAGESGICKDSTITTTNVVRNVRPYTTSLTTRDLPRRDDRYGTPPAEKLTGIESQNKVIIQIRAGCGAQEADSRRRLHGQ